MKQQKLNCGMIGPVTMGCKLIYNMSDHGYAVIGFDKNNSQVKTLKKVAGILWKEIELFLCVRPGRTNKGVLTPVINFWTTNPPVNFPNYKAVSQGAEDAEILIAKDGHSWFNMPINNLS
jgi:hypothetical protein